MNSQEKTDEIITLRLQLKEKDELIAKLQALATGPNGGSLYPGHHETVPTQYPGLVPHYQGPTGCSRCAPDRCDGC